MRSLIERLRERLVTVPKPGSKPFKPTQQMILYSTGGGEHKPGDPAGYSNFNPTANACAAGHDSTYWMALEMVYAVDPLCEEAAQALEKWAQTVEKLEQGK